MSMLKRKKSEESIMEKKLGQGRKGENVLTVATILLLIACALPGLFSINFQSDYEVTNQYGEVIRMYGYGIYAHESYFKAPINIGTDLIILVLVIPMFLWDFIQSKRRINNYSRMFRISLYGVALYYGASIAFGSTYNRLHLIYIGIVGCSFFGMVSEIRKEMEDNRSQEKRRKPLRLSKGMAVFLAVSGIALIIAWLPEIVPTLLNGKPLALIEVYTTCPTYVLDMGILGPSCILCIYLIQKQDLFAPILYAILLQLCFVVGVMVIAQTFFQGISGLTIPVAAMITKVGAFVVLGLFSLYFQKKLYGISDN